MIENNCIIDIPDHLVRNNPFTVLGYEKFAFRISIDVKCIDIEFGEPCDITTIYEQYNEMDDPDAFMDRYKFGLDITLIGSDEDDKVEELSFVFHDSGMEGRNQEFCNFMMFTSNVIFEHGLVSEARKIEFFRTMGHPCPGIAFLSSLLPIYEPEDFEDPDFCLEFYLECNAAVDKMFDIINQNEDYIMLVLAHQYTLLGAIYNIEEKKTTPFNDEAWGDITVQSQVTSIGKTIVFPAGYFSKKGGK